MQVVWPKAITAMETRKMCSTVAWSTCCRHQSASQARPANMSAPVVLAIGSIVLLVVGTQVSQAEAIMGSHKVDGVWRRSAPFPFSAPIVGPPLPFCRLDLAVQVGASAHGLGKGCCPRALCALPPLQSCRYLQKFELFTNPIL